MKTTNTLPKAKSLLYPVLLILQFLLAAPLSAPGSSEC